MTIKTREEAEAFAQKLADRDSSTAHDTLEMLIALGVWTPEEPPKPVEKTPADLLEDKMAVRYGYERRDEGRSIRPIITDVLTCIESAGLKLIKASDELVAVEYDEANRALRKAGATGEHDLLSLVFDKYVIAKRAGA